VHISNNQKKDSVLELIHRNFLFLMELIIERISSHSSQNVNLPQIPLQFYQIWLKKLKLVITKHKKFSSIKQEIVQNLTQNNKMILVNIQKQGRKNKNIENLLKIIP